MKTLLSFFNLTHSGSKIIFENLIDEFHRPDILFLIDKTQQKNISPNFKSYVVNYELSNFKWLKKHLIEQIYIPYICQLEKVQKIILFGNLPVLISNIKQIVFFHNLLYIEKYEKNLFQIINQSIFRFLTNIKKPFLITQSKYVKDKLIEIFSINHIYQSKTSVKHLKIQPKLHEISSSINIIYPSFPYFYKNHAFLLENISIFERLEINLWLTCDKSDLPEHAESTYLHFTGKLDIDTLMNYFFNSQGIINTSEFESLGMYLLEAVALSKPLISCDKEYVKSIIEDFYQFKHLDKNSLSDALINFKKDFYANSLILPKSDLISNPKEIVDNILNI